MRISGIIELLLTIVIFVLLINEYKSDLTVMRILADFDLQAKFYTLFLYMLPAIHIISGVLAIVFAHNKKLMIGMCVMLAIFTLPHLFYVKGIYQVARCIIVIASTVNYILANIFSK